MSLLPLEPGHAPGPGECYLVRNWCAPTASGRSRYWIGVICSVDMLDPGMEPTKPKSGADVRDTSIAGHNPCKGISHDLRQWAVFLPWKGCYRWVEKTQLFILSVYDPDQFEGENSDETSEFLSLWCMTERYVPKDKKKRLEYWRDQIANQLVNSSPQSISTSSSRTIRHSENWSFDTFKHGSPKDRPNSRKFQRITKKLELPVNPFRDDEIDTIEDQDVTQRSLAARKQPRRGRRQGYDSEESEDSESGSDDDDDDDDEEIGREIDHNIEISNLQNAEAELREKRELIEKELKNIRTGKASTHPTSRSNKRKRENDFILAPLTGVQRSEALTEPSVSVIDKTNMEIKYQDGSNVWKPAYHIDKWQRAQRPGSCPSIVQIYIGTLNEEIPMIKNDVLKVPLLSRYMQTRNDKSYIMDPDFRQLDPVIFKSLADYLNYGEYHPFLNKLNGTKSYSLVDSNDAKTPDVGIYSKALVHSSKLYRLAEQFDIDNLKSLITFKLSHAFPLGYQASVLLKVTRILFENYTDRKKALIPTVESIKTELNSPKSSLTTRDTQTTSSPLRNHILILLAQNLESLFLNLGQETKSLLDDFPLVRRGVYGNRFRMEMEVEEEVEGSKEDGKVAASGRKETKEGEGEGEGDRDREEQRPEEDASVVWIT